MPLAKEDFESITRHIKENLPTWLAEQSWGQPPHVYEIELRERMVRVEEELKNQRELMKQGFELMEKRFEQMDKRFEQVDKRHEDLRQDMMARFEQVDQRFEQLTRRLDRFMIWSFGTTVSMAGIVIAVLKFT